MVKNKRVFRVLISVVVMVCVAVTFFLFPVSARVADTVDSPFKYIVASSFDADGDRPLLSSEFDYASVNDGTMTFKTYLSSSENIVALRVHLNDFFNTGLWDWVYIDPVVLHNNTNVFYYTFTVIPDSYTGDIATGEIDRRYIVYQAVYNLTTTSFKNEMKLVNEIYGDAWWQVKSAADNYEIRGSCDLVIEVYSPDPKTNFVVNFNPLRMSWGQGARPPVSDMPNGEYNPVPPEDWYNQLGSDKEVYESIDKELSEVLGYISNPATILNDAISKTQEMILWPEVSMLLYVIDGFFGIPVINYTAWAIALFGSVFSLFNLGISFVSVGVNSVRHSRDVNRGGKNGRS